MLFIFREGKRGRKRGRETSVCGCLSHAAYRGPGPPPRHVPWLGIELAILWFTGPPSIHWATPDRQNKIFLSVLNIKVIHHHYKNKRGVWYRHEKRNLKSPIVPPTRNNFKYLYSIAFFHLTLHFNCFLR